MGSVGERRKENRRRSKGYRNILGVKDLQEVVSGRDLAEKKSTMEVVVCFISTCQA